ncbi:N-acetylglucosamine kinase-like BadF-type ATPase [Tamaricihabitans halophyticus]|uniref:N-acetylglucosamine kinase-like BadF-type ATPase n=1 Tax=Tamaricihabitans halophyticus TaxID=1262583 RepID=A0A4R2R1P2_9PSEU|nr:BadF/BadG/BcrA/BcrD ATPase family protein [Tamaricihabitans halophyticus]TCP56620.1 N-acetylglucosamine kinase-like BadF-type ATPase [Tamaricihabitans halophyticus]
MSYVLGVDTGGTTTRAVVTDLAGTVLGTGRSGGGNPNSHAPEQAAKHLAEAIDAALHGVAAPAEVAAAVVGMAGTSKLTDPAVASTFATAWASLGCEVDIRTDVEVAYASATAEPDGTLLIGGTGSIAGQIRTRRLIRTVGGYGWLLGDEGSAFWVGRAAIRATLRALETEDALGELAGKVLAESGLGPDEPMARRRLWRELITAANAQQPIQLARFAPLVSTAAEQADPAALEIVREAGDVLVQLALDAREAAESTPVVLAGSVLGQDSPIGRRVRTELTGHGIRVLSTGDGVRGAAWLAAVRILGEQAPHPLG